MEDQLSKQTSVFGIRLWVVVGIAVGAAIVVFLFLMSLWLISKRNTNKSKRKTESQIPTTNTTTIIPVLSKEIQEITTVAKQSDPLNDPNRIMGAENQALIMKAGGEERIQIEIMGQNKLGGSSSVGRNLVDHPGPNVVPEVSHLGWGRWYTLRELEVATNEFSDQNVIGEGGYGIVYYGVLDDNTQIAVKNLLNNK